VASCLARSGGDPDRAGWPLFQVVVAGTKVSIPPQAKLESRYRTYWYMRTD
jgi:hypothetical protein